MMNPVDAPNDIVLVAEDDRRVANLLVRRLRGWGYSPVHAADGETAIEAVHNERPGVVLLNVHLPQIDGIEVCRRLKLHASTRLTPVILLTGMADRKQRIAGIRAGADEFLRKPFDSEELSARIAALLRLKRHTDDLDSAESVILTLALTVEARDAYTDGHCQRLARYATLLGSRIGLRSDDLAALHRGAYLHDVGKVAIPDALLNKPSGLTDAERAIIEQHPVIGEQLCGSLQSLQRVRAIVRHHHERRDGTGYPDGLQSDEIPLLAEIVSIVDTYDAITTTRPYRNARSHQDACKELLRDATNGVRHQDLVYAFVDTIGSYRDGST